MVLDGLGSFGINVGGDDDLCLRVLIGQCIHFTDCDGLIDRMPLVREPFSERMRSYSGEQDQGHSVLSFRLAMIRTKYCLASFNLCRSSKTSASSIVSFQDATVPI